MAITDRHPDDVPEACLPASMFFTAALRDATSGPVQQWKVIAWHNRVPTAVFRLLSPRFSASRLTSSDVQPADHAGEEASTSPLRAYFVRTRQQALRNVVTHKDAKGTKWQVCSTSRCARAPLG